MKGFHSITTGHLDMGFNNSRSSNELSYDDQLELQQTLIEEAHQNWVQLHEAYKMKTNQIETQAHTMDNLSILSIKDI